MKNLFGRTIKGLCRFYVCHSCNFKVCKHFLLPKEPVDDKCLICEARYWYQGPPIFKDFENCNCYVHSHNNCGNMVLYF